MPSIALQLLLESPVGTLQSLPRGGTVLENRFVYDSVAREMRGYAKEGRLEIVGERASPPADGGLTIDFTFKRLI